eukprot:gb/GECG01003752.1/.p1 GENE.gb/GECG01003752.1/~~gb/GECG01003752.1/.p1  ORF type:complete len:317 (+),score=35.26 gb/GECG01003752.1/:1-951(+)
MIQKRMSSFFVGAILACLAVTTWAAATKEIKLGDATVMVSSSRTQTGSSGGSKPNAQTISYPKALSQAISASAGEYVHVLLPVTDKDTGDAFEPHQSVLRLSRKEDGATAYIPAVASTKSEDALRITVDVSNRGLLKQVADGGEVEATILLGDTRIKNQISWKIGTISLYPPAAPAEAEGPLYTKPLLHESETTLKPLKEITHVFKEPEPRPPVIVPVAFALLTTVPWLAYFFYFLKQRLIGVSTVPVLPAIIFHSCLLAILLLYLCYWFGFGGINMFSTLGYLTVLAVPTAFSGNRLLRGLRQSQLNAPPGKKEQ